jgi:excisionase family DNA binding protein
MYSNGALKTLVFVRRLERETAKSLNPKAMTDPNDLLNIKQAAEFLNVSETSLRRWTNSGRLSCMRVGLRRERRFRRGDLLALLESEPTSEQARSGPRPAPTERDVSDGLAVPRGVHLCVLYASDEGRERLASTFLLDGLRLGSACFLVAAPEIRSEITNKMAALRPSLHSDIGEGRLTLTEHGKSGAALLNYYERHLLAGMKAGVVDFRVVGIMHSFQRRIGSTALVEFEVDFDHRIMRRFPVTTLCLYDARLFTGVECLQALNGHRDSLRFPADRWIA